MRCVSCGSDDHQPGARFCANCGRALAAVTCTNCGLPLDTAHRFCPGCGLPAQTAHPASREPDRPINYMPPHLVEQIIATRATIEGELKQATILFADIVDSTRLTYGKGPEEANLILEPAIEVMRASVFGFEGYVRPRGDGIEGLFGVPLSQEDHAERGCLAALELIAGMARLNRTLVESGREPIQVRVGLNSGEVIVKRILDDLLLEFDAIGATVALASRMERLAAPNTALITAATFSLAQRVVKVESRGKVEVRGVNDAVEVFRLEGALKTPVRFRQPNGGVTNFVGRALELDTLVHVWQEASSGHGQVVAFVGEPGVGKSRLFAEFTRDHRLQGANVLEARSVSYGRATPYLPVINLLRAYFEVHVSDDTRYAKEKIVDKLQALGVALTPHASALFDLLDLGVDDANWRNCDPIERRRKLQEAVVELLLREVRSGRPLCLVFEDLHWVDSETKSLLDKIVALVPTRSILLLVNYRPGYENHWGRKTYFRQLPIAPLPTSAAHKLLDDLLGVHADLAPLKARLIDQTAGNPLFLEECVHMLTAQSVIEGDRGAARLAQPLTHVEYLPASVQATLKARIDRLEPQQKHVLDFACVFGKDFSHANLSAAIDLDAGVLSACLGELQNLEFIHQTRRVPETEFTFKHALTYQVAYHSLLNSRRRAMHATILRSMEHRFGERTSDHAEELARHALHGEVWDKALRYTFEAGQKAFDRSAHTETVRHLEDALKALKKVGEHGDNLQLAVQTRFLLRHALLNLGETDRVGRLLAETAPLIRVQGVPQLAAQFEAFQSNYFCLTNDQPRAIEHGLRGLRIAEAEQNRPLRVEMAFRIAQPYYQLARYRDAVQLLEPALELVKPDETRSRLGMSALPLVVCHTWLTVCYAELGEFARAAENASAAVALVTETEHPLSTAFAWWGQGHLYLQQRDYGPAVSALQKGLEASQRWSLRSWQPRLASALGLARALIGEIEIGAALVEQAVDEAEVIQFAVDRPRLLERLATVHLIAGRHALAESKALDALDLATRSDAKGLEASTLRLLGEVALATDRSAEEEAENRFRRALGLAEGLGMRPLAALCYEGLSRAQAERGQRQEAEKSLRRAGSLWAELGC
jgi:class 3 adenylate cyclase/tetratricopeptide (TPR) repeat protein